LGFDGKFILLNAAERVVAAEIFGGFDHAAEHRIVAAAGCFAATTEGVAQQETASSSQTPTGVNRVQRCLAHDIDTACDDQIAHAGLHLHGGVKDGLQAAATAAINLHATHSDGQSCIKSSDAGYRHSLGRGVGLTEDDLVNESAIDAGADDQFGDDRRSQVSWSDIFEHTAKSTDWGA
jgi:hypothetical protein